MYKRKYAALLLSSIGISNVGDWIYLIAINLLVLEMTSSPLAVAMLYVLKPLATISINWWAGGVIDRVQTKSVMIIMDVGRGILILCIPSLPSLWMMYGFVFVINMGSSIFEPASRTYITQLLPEEKRMRFNSLRSMVDSGAFLTGPALAGLLFITSTPAIAIYVNGVSFVVSALLLHFLPNKKVKYFSSHGSNTFSNIKEDVRIVIAFSQQYLFVMVIYSLFSFMYIMASAIDSLEAAFAKEVLGLSNTSYGILVSIAGAGVVVGAIVNMAGSMKWKAVPLIIGGTTCVALGYVVYAFSDGFAGAAVGFFVLSFSLSFANVGFQTFYQTHIPVPIMGRVTSLYGWVEALMVLIVTGVIGLTAQIVTVRAAVMGAVILMLCITILLSIYSWKGRRGLSVGSLPLENRFL
ncbi:MFS transporter [Pontibacillus salicampi]|uniref:MFS transporter n=1 Tax=Pontibacillus salicampi TaxID=1449801 RepID=A0ABV6LKQ0_9BACI